MLTQERHRGSMPASFRLHEGRGTIIGLHVDISALLDQQAEHLREAAQACSAAREGALAMQVRSAYQVAVTSMWPPLHAPVIGVSPASDLALTSAPLSRSICRAKEEKGHKGRPWL